MLSQCKTLVDLGDKGPYQGLVESLSALCTAVNPKKVPSEKRRRARQLRSILKGVYSRIKECARQEYSGVAQLLFTEISGHGGLSIFRRLDAACVANKKTEQKTSVDFRRGLGASRGPRARGMGQRGRGGGRRNLEGVTIAFDKDTRNNCPEGGQNAQAAENQ